MWSQWCPTRLPLSVRSWKWAIASWLLTASAWSVWNITCEYKCLQILAWSPLHRLSPCTYSFLLSVFLCRHSGRELIRTSGDSLKLLVAKIDSKTSSSATNKCWRKSSGGRSSAIGEYWRTCSCTVRSSFLLHPKSVFLSGWKTHSLLFISDSLWGKVLRKERWDNQPKQQDSLVLLITSVNAISIQKQTVGIF